MVGIVDVLTFPRTVQAQWLRELRAVEGVKEERVVGEAWGTSGADDWDKRLVYRLCGLRTPSRKGKKNSHSYFRL